MTNENHERMMIRTLQHILTPSTETYSITLTTTSLESITAWALLDHIKTVATDAIITLKHELELVAITHAPRTVNDKIKINTLKISHKELVLTNKHLWNQITAIINRQNVMDTILSPLNHTVPNTVTTHPHDTDLDTS